MTSKVRYLLSRDGRYFARLVVPLALRPYLEGKTELRTALGPDRRQALTNLPGAVARLQIKIGLADKRSSQGANGGNMGASRYPLNTVQIAELEYRQEMEMDALIRAQDHRYAQFEVDADVARMFRDGYSGILSDDQLEQLVGDRLRRAQMRGNTSARKGSPEWRAIAQALCVASYEAMARRIERNEGDFTGAPAHPLLASASAGKHEPNFITFDQIIDAETTRRARGKDAKPLPRGTVKKYRDAANEFSKFRQSDDATSVTASEGKQWIEAMQDGGSLGNRTVKSKLQNVRTILNWGRKSDPSNFVDGNPLKDVQLPDYNSIPSYLRSFTVEEAKLVLKAARKESFPMFRWIPWMCAYSGMRVSEAGGLEQDDFFQSHGRWFWRLTTVGGRSLKTESGERRIPVHRALEDEGLITFVQSAGRGRLFTGRTKEKVLAQPRMSKWVRNLIPFELRPELSPNHGWRHLFEDFCRRDLLPDDARKYITGRTDGNSSESYGRSDVMLPGLAAAMDMIVPIDCT